LAVAATPSAAAEAAAPTSILRRDRSVMFHFLPLQKISKNFFLNCLKIKLSVLELNQTASSSLQSASPTSMLIR
jgi:hypothetical protein